MLLRTRNSAATFTVALIVAACSASATPPTSPSQGATPTEPVATASASQPSPVPSSTPGSTSSLSWSAEPFPGEIQGLTTHSGSFVAVGRDQDGLASWTSTDGVAWERHPVPDPAFIEELVNDFGPDLYDGTSMGSMTALGDTLFSIGTFWGPNDFYRPVGWRSTNGASWEFIESDNEFYQYGTVTDLATLDRTLVAAHATGLIAAGYSLWTWTAGTSWQQSAVQSTSEETIPALHVAVGARSVLAVGGSARATDAPQDEWPSHPVAWRSGDAVTWQEVAPPDGLSIACGVATIPDGGFAVAGTTDSGDLGAWTTEDGSSWTAAGATSSPDGDCVGLAHAGDSVVLTAADAGGGIWLSADGLTWTRETIPSVDSVTGHIAELDGLLLVIARSGSANDQQTVLLRGRAGD